LYVNKDIKNTYVKTKA